MKIFAHDGNIINLETVASVRKRQDFSCYQKKFYLSFKFIGKNDNSNTINTSSFNEEVINDWLNEISITMREKS